MVPKEETSIEAEIRQAAEVLRKGGIILYPTDTVWGLGCDPTNPAAVDKIFSIKKRDKDKSLIMLVDSESRLRNYVNDIPEIAYGLIDVAVRPLTIIYDSVSGIAPSVCADDGSAGIRITKERFSSGLCRKFGKPVVSTSANFSGSPSPKKFSEIDPGLIAKADYVVGYRQDDESAAEPSDIIKVSEGGLIKIIR